MKRLTSKEIASRRERGLCFTCDEKYHRGHRCVSRVFIFLAEGDDPPDADIEPHDPQPEPPDPISPHTPFVLNDPVQAQISLNSLAGHVTPETLRLVGVITDRQVVLLVDDGSTHNFIQEELVTQLGLPCQSTPPLRVMVGNGQNLECSCVCIEITVEIQSVQFLVDLHVLPIFGANIVLGGCIGSSR